jgi:diadenosine tetraphosphate (Ap4A) HIT family hydrolase
MAFLDIAPIRPGHTHIIPKQHFDTFDVLPSELAGRIMVLGQIIARKLKSVYRVSRVAFVFTGGDVAHAPTLFRWSRRLTSRQRGTSSVLRSFNGHPTIST